MVDPVFGRACASIGVYDLLGSAYAAFIDIYTSLEVTVDNATSYLKVYLSDILVTGIWAVDNFAMSFRSPKFETLEFSNVPFVYANFSNVGVGSLALGISQSDNGFKYNFISNFVINGLISSNSYSLALGANNGTYPQLILGGVDKSLIYSDPKNNENPDSKMALFDFIPVQDESGMYINDNGGLSTTAPAFPVYGWGVTSSSTGQSVVFSSYYNARTEIASYPKPALIDSRHNYNFIPYSTLVEIAIELNAYYSSDLGIWLADCSVGDTGTIDLYLGNYTIHMAISNFLNPALVKGTSLVFSSGDPACYLTFLPDYYLGYSLMGTPLLKNIYLAIDNENRQMGISQLQDQLKDADIVVSETTQVQRSEILDVDIETSVGDEQTSSEMDQKAVETTAAESHFSHGVTPLSQQELSRTMTVTTSTTISGSYVSTYKTVVTVSNVFTSVSATGDPEFYAIESGTIPFAERFTTVTSLTLTIPNYVVFTDTSVQSTEVYISGGEVFLQTNGSNGGDTQAKKTHSTETDSTIYAFSSLIVSKVSSSRSSGAGSRVHAPGLLRFEASREMYHGLKLAGYFSALVLCVAVLF